MIQHIYLLLLLIIYYCSIIALCSIIIIFLKRFFKNFQIGFGVGYDTLLYDMITQHKKEYVKYLRIIFLFYFQFYYCHHL